MSDVDAGVPVISSFRGQHRFLSNFAPASVVWEGLTYPTVEHAYQAAKVLTAPTLREYIRNAPTPGQAKKLGQGIHLGSDWIAWRRFFTMRALIALKFPPNGDLTELLLATGEAHLVEGNAWHDNLWGDCTCDRAAECEKPGLNVLGQMLEDRRRELRCAHGG